MGPDRTSIAWRRGRVIETVESRRGLDTMEVAGWVQRIIREDKPAKVNIDVGGLGVGVHDRLRETSSNRRMLNAINFGGKPVEHGHLMSVAILQAVQQTGVLSY